MPALWGGASGKADRFAINLRSNLFQCRKCDIRGGDQIALVMQILGMGFLDALTWLCGDKPAEIDPVEMERRRKLAATDKKKQDDYAARARAKARNDARIIWGNARGQSRGILWEYFARRGITHDMLKELPRCLRVIPDHPYVKKIDGKFVTAHRGPAMIALIQNPDNRGSAVHQTWLDPSQKNGKAVIEHNGEAMGAKLVRGSKKGGAIRMFMPDAPDTLVMGEGIETTLSALVAAPFENAAYWAGVDLGNMSGRMQWIKGQRYSGLPDMSDRGAFVPPAWVKRLVFVMDGDSEPKMARAKLECGLKRAMARRPGLTAQIVRAGEGVDLNDVLMGAA